MHTGCGGLDQLPGGGSGLSGVRRRADQGERGIVRPADGTRVGAGQHWLFWRRPATSDAVWGERGRGLGELPPVFPAIEELVQVSLHFLYFE